MDEKKKPVEDVKPAEEAMVKASEIQGIVAAAVAAAIAQQKHQHTPLALPELQGRSRAEGVLIETKLGETKSYVEVQYNDGTIRRDYK